MALLLLLAGCTSSREPDPRDSARLLVFYNNDNFGYLETCGCRVSPIGGMDRRWNAMKRHPDASRVFVDAGNLLFKATEASEFLAPQWREQAAAVIEAYNLLGADAVAPGETDFALGLPAFRELATKAKFPFLSSNIVYKEGGAALLPGSRVVSRFGKKIGIFGVFGAGLRLPAELEAKDPVAAARRMVEQLRKEGSELVIALSHQGYDADVQLARAVPGIDLLVGAHSQSLLQKPDEEGKTLLVQLSSQGQMLGMVEYDPRELPRRSGFAVAELDAEFDEAPAGLANPMKALVAVTNLRVQETNRGLDRKIWEEHDRKLPASGFETSLSCRECHAKQAAFHERRPHSGAFLSLLQKGKERDLDCVRCHSLGLGQSGGFESLADAFRDGGGRPVALEEIRKAAGAGFPKPGSYREAAAKLEADVRAWDAAMKKSGVRKSFVSVQCESCHGAMPGHPFSSFHPAPVRITSCVLCHTREQAPAWYGADGNLLEAKAKGVLEKMRCPR